MFNITDALGEAKKAQVKRMEILTNNLANSMTPGYKAIRPLFHEILVSQASAKGEDDDSASGFAVSTFIDFSPAPLLRTEGALNVAIDGPGFFAVSTPEGMRYTRNGQFSIDEERMLVTRNGHPVMGENGKILVKDSSIRIETDGTVFSDMNPAGRIKVVYFKDRGRLEAAGGGLFRNAMEGNEMTVQGMSSVRHGFVESSNVNLTTEMVELMTCMRAYQAYKKIDSSIDDCDDKMLTIMIYQ